MTAVARVRALDILLADYPPMIRGRAPFWRPAPAQIEDQVYEPAWSWVSSTPVTEDVVVLDLIAAYLAAATSVKVAHGRLVSAGVERTFDKNRAGYWRVTVHPWTVPDLFSPLGTARLGTEVWVTTPTAALLADLTEEGHWPGIDVHESWTCPYTVRLRPWAQHMSALRREAIMSHDRELYDAIKISYSQAVTLMGVDRKSKIFRPDWGRAIRTQHAANTWRKAWRAYQLGHGPVAAGSVDELAFRRRSLQWMRSMREAGRPMPVKVDPTGVSLGSWRVKGTYTAEAWAAR